MKLFHIVVLVLLLGFESVGALAIEPLFNAPIKCYAGRLPYSLCAFDFNGDGYPDAATGNEFDMLVPDPPDGISIHFSNGDGTFQSPINYELGDVPESISAVDLDGDGVEDILATKCEYDEIVVMLGHADGTFEPPVCYAAGNTPRECCYSDFDSDGDIDLAVTNETSGNILIMFNDGNASFTDSQSYGLAQTPTSICTADFDNDGDFDIAVGQYNDISILLNDGDGTFQISFVLHEGEGAASIASDDFNQDGVKDLVVVYKYSYCAAVMLGWGDGNFRSATYYLNGRNVQKVLLSDVDSDGMQDLVIREGSSKISVLKGKSNGTFGDLKVNDLWETIRAISMADIDGDGDSDIVATGLRHIYILVNRNHGIFCDLKHYDAGYDPEFVIASEFNGDELPDLAVIDKHEQEIGIFLNNGDGTLQDRVCFSAPGMFSICAADVDGDGDNDLVASPGGDSLRIYLNDGDGNMQLGFSCRAGENSYVVRAADFDNDGDTDLAVGGGELTILMKKDQTLDYAAPQKYSSDGADPASLSICDFNGDGYADLAVANDETENIAVLLNDGNGRFDDPVTYYAGSVPSAISTSDLDGDGNDDIVIVNKYTDSLRVFLGKGDGTFGDGIAHFGGGGIRDICISDFDLDGDNDIAAYCGYSAISMTLNRGDGTFQQAYYMHSGMIYSFCAVDINGDMRTDIVVATDWLYAGDDFFVIENVGYYLAPAYRDPPDARWAGFIRNYPNPFNPVTTIRLTIPRAGRVKVVIYDVNGRSIAVLVDRFMASGVSEVIWNGKSEDGRIVSSGVYFARMTIDGHSSVRKIVLLR